MGLFSRFKSLGAWGRPGLPTAVLAPEAPSAPVALLAPPPQAALATPQQGRKYVDHDIAIALFAGYLHDAWSGWWTAAEITGFYEDWCGEENIEEMPLQTMLAKLGKRTGIRHQRSRLNAADQLWLRRYLAGQGRLRDKVMVYRIAGAAEVMAALKLPRKPLSPQRLAAQRRQRDETIGVRPSDMMAADMRAAA